MTKKYGKWSVKTSLGEGGQSLAFLATAEDDETLFVLKRLKNKNRIDRFKAEIRAGLELKHPNVLRVVDYDLGSSPFLVAEYCAGGSLKDVDISSLTLGQRLQLFQAICQGVGHAHANGVIHRDLKPENIFLRSDLITPVVGDFGICFITDEGQRITLTDEAVGARLYIAPELEDGRAEEVTTASDVYSLGKLLYWMLSGKIFARERHRDGAFDLTTGQVRPDYYFVYELLDRMIQPAALGRIANANQVFEALDDVIRRIEMDAHVLDLRLPQLCSYCGIGCYTEAGNQDYSKADNARAFFGLTGIGSPQWLVLVCEHCGHVQIFRPDLAKDQTVWKHWNVR